MLQRVYLSPETCSWLGLMIALSQLFRSDGIGLWIVLGLSHRLNIWSERAKLLQYSCAPEG